MPEIRVSFEVFKQLTIRRKSEEDSYSDVIERLLKEEDSYSDVLERLLKKDGLSLQQNGSSVASRTPWVWKGVQFPEGTQFRAEYKGRLYTAEVKGGALLYAGKSYKSPSAAAFQITRSSVNGWYFWECQLPGESKWTLINDLRANSELKGEDSLKKFNRLSMEEQQRILEELQKTMAEEKDK